MKMAGLVAKKYKKNMAVLMSNYNICVYEEKRKKKYLETITGFDLLIIWFTRLRVLLTNSCDIMYGKRVLRRKSMNITYACLLHLVIKV